MFRLFSKIPHGLNPVSTMFKQHVCAEGTALVKQAEDAASNKKAEKRDVVGLQKKLIFLKFQCRPENLHIGVIYNYNLNRVGQETIHWKMVAKICLQLGYAKQLCLGALSGNSECRSRSFFFSYSIEHTTA